MTKTDFFPSSLGANAPRKISLNHPMLNSSEDGRRKGYEWRWPNFDSNNRNPYNRTINYIQESLRMNTPNITAGIRRMGVA